MPDDSPGPSRAATGDILIAHPSERFAESLGSAIFHARKSSEVRCCRDSKTLKRLIARRRPELLITELRLLDGPSLSTLQWVREHFPELRIVVVTEHGSIASAVRCTRIGIDSYYSEQVPVERLLTPSPASLNEEPAPMRLERAVWEYLNRVVDRAGSITRGADALGVDRRSLRRMLGRYMPPR
jgi:ActR/RegA family two-component response regulator